MLKIGGIINIIIAIAHLVGLIWAEQMFEVTGIGKEMAKFSIIHPTIPYLITIVGAMFFFAFGIYGLSADNKFRKLPFLKIGIFTISGIFIFRGVGELIFDMSKQNASTFAEATYSLIALGIGLLYLIGGLKKWPLKKRITKDQNKELN
ncbi:MAG: hypothetical protein V3V14_00230 [Saprospiraceae bacterium]